MRFAHPATRFTPASKKCWTPPDAWAVSSKNTGADRLPKNEAVVFSHAAPIVKKAPQAGAFLLLAQIIFDCILIGTHAAEFATVKSITDGDTIKLTDGSSVRLTGVNCPEKSRGNKAAEPFALAAKRTLEKLLHNRRAKVIDGQQNRDAYKRRLAYVFTPSGVDVQKELLKNGYCSIVAIPPNLRFIKQYQNAEAFAKRSGKGIWQHDYFRYKNAGELKKTNTGFQFVSGRVRHVGQSKKDIYLNVSKRFTVRIPKVDWNKYFSGKPRKLKGKRLQVSGWVSHSERGLQMKVQHPAMMKIE